MPFFGARSDGCDHRAARKLCGTDRAQAKLLEYILAIRIGNTGDDILNPKKLLDNLGNCDIQIIVRRGNHNSVAAFHAGVPKDIHVHRHPANAHTVKIRAQTAEIFFIHVDYGYIMTSPVQQIGDSGSKPAAADHQNIHLTTFSFSSL